MVPIYDELKQGTEREMSNPVAEQRTYLRQLFSDIHNNDGPTDDLAIDSALGLDRERVESGFTLGKLLVAYGNHCIETVDIPYSAIRDLYRALNVSPALPCWISEQAMD